MAKAEQARSPWVVHKFGGTSLADAEHYHRAAGILKQRGDSHQAIVVSAMAGITNRLLHLVELASENLPYQAELDEVHRIQKQATQILAGVDVNAKVDAAAVPNADSPADSAADLDALRKLHADISDIADILHSASLVGHAGTLVHDRVSGYGELWSARQLTAYLNRQGVFAQFLDARKFIITTPTEMGPSVDWNLSQRGLNDCLKLVKYEGFPSSISTSASASANRTTSNSTDDPTSDSASNPTCLVITGYIAADVEGHTTTLGRNGSDYSASIVGKLLHAQAINIWTDVDGVMSADPRLVPNAQVLETLSFDEALELAYFGASVMHPQTMTPAIQAQIPVFIRNTFKPDGSATRIGKSSADGFQIKGISATNGQALINLEGTGMIGVPGTARRVFDAIKRASISVVMISQANSEHSICFVVHENSADATRLALQDEFRHELENGMVQSIAVTMNCSILAVVGDAMVGQVGVAAQFFTALAEAGISIRAIAQGSSERNISTVIDSQHERRAVRAVHAAFYLSAQTLSIGLVGAGKVGAEFLRQLGQEQQRMKDESNIDLRVRAIANSHRMLLSEQSIDPATWKEEFQQHSQPVDLAELQNHVKADHLPHAVLLDCTASDAVAQLHQQWLRAGIHVMTANKKANAGSLENYKNIRAAAAAGNARYLYEATVGAGLPVIKVLEDLQGTGDRIHSIEGVFSGTLAYLFNRYDGSIPFSELVREAWKLGYTEPDPREDLSGMDVARKLVILGREMGLDLSVKDLELSSLLPADPAAADPIPTNPVATDPIASNPIPTDPNPANPNPADQAETNVESFLDQLAESDPDMGQKWKSAQKRGNVLRFIGRLNKNGKAKVGLVELPQSHPFAHTNLTDNVIQFKTDRYCENPLVIQGPGAGPEVTAAGVFADLLRLCGDLGAHV